MSIHSAIRSILVALVVVTAGNASAFTQDTDVQVVKMNQSRGTTMELGFGTSQWLYPLDEPAEELLTEPEYVSERLVRYSAVFGDAEDNTFALVIDESTGTGRGYDVLYVDANNNDRIDGERERHGFAMSTVRMSHPCRIKLQVTTAGRTNPYYVDFKAFP